MRRFFFVIPIVCIGLTCVGCGRPTRPEDDLFGSGLRNAARGIVAGRAYDDLLLASRRQDDAAYDRALEQLDRSGTPREAWLRLALDLNETGYILADEGRSTKDHLRAEALLRRSLTYWDKYIDSEPEKSEFLIKLRFMREVSSHDSLAWALYRQKRFSEALSEQETVLRVANANLPKIPDTKSGLSSLYYHLGKIHQAMGHNTEAQSAFTEALKLRPNYPEAERELKK